MMTLWKGLLPPPESLSMSIFVWNCQGAAAPKFHSVLKSFLKGFRPHIVILVEPRISGSQAEKVIKKTGYPHSHRVEACGFSGGIWLLWSLDVELEVLVNNYQFIHASAKWPNLNKSTLITAIYGSPCPKWREDLWKELSGLSISTQSSWLMSGDFNATLTAD